MKCIFASSWSLELELQSGNDMTHHLSYATVFKSKKKENVYDTVLWF